MSGRAQARRTGLPLFVEGEQLVVRGRDGGETRLPLTGGGAVAALVPYRYTRSATSSERGRGRRTWWRVGGRGSGHPPPGFRSEPGTVAEAGAFWGPSWQGSFQLEVEWGVAAVDSRGTVLLRMRPLRSLGRVRRFAQAHGLVFVEEQLTDRDRLGRAPAVVTAVAEALGPVTRGAIDVASCVPAAAVGLAAGTAAATDPGNVVGVAVVAGGLTFATCRGLLRWLAGRRGARSTG